MNIFIGIDVILNGVPTRVWTGKVYSDFDSSLVVTNMADGHTAELTDREGVVVTVANAMPGDLPEHKAPAVDLPGWIGHLSLN